MYEFAIVALLALAVVKFADFIVGPVPALDNFRAWLHLRPRHRRRLHPRLSLFEGYGIAVRNEDMGMILTGFMIAGLTTPWRVLFSWMPTRAPLTSSGGRPEDAAPPSHRRGREPQRQTGGRPEGRPPPCGAQNATAWLSSSGGCGGRPQEDATAPHRSWPGRRGSERPCPCGAGGRDLGRGGQHGADTWAG